MANIFTVTAAHKGRKLPLRGDMDGALLNLVPSDNAFPVRFFTEDAKQYTITALKEFRVKGVTTSNKSFTFGGKAGLWVEFIYETGAGVWVMTSSNLEAAGVGGGSAIATNFSVLSTTTGAAGTAANVEIVDGSTANVKFKFTIPQGAAGTGGSGGSGTTLPTPTKIGDVLTATGTQAGQYSWVTPSGASSGGGVDFTPEVLISQNAQGQIILDRTLGNNFRVMLTMNGKVMNPVGYQPGEVIHVAIRQAPTGPYTLEWDLAWAHPDRQVPILSKQPGGLNELEAYLTDAIDAGNPGGWMTKVSPQGSSIGFGVPSYIARNVTTGVEYYVLRSSTLLSGMTSMKPGETLKILRNGLGIEAYGAVDGSNGAGSYLISGVLPNGNRAELRTGPGVRSAFDRGVLAFGGNTPITATVQDLILSGAREQSGEGHIAQGVSVTGAANVILRNVKLYDNENGLLSANDWTGRLDMFDCEFDGNGVGADYGFVHNIYMGHTNQAWYATRCTFKNVVGGHNIKSRLGEMVLKQVYCYNSQAAREMEMPNGGKLDAQDCIFEHLENAQQNDCVRIGAEGIDTGRPRGYVFRNCKFINRKGFANEASYVWNDDPDYDVYLIDCTFEGAGNWPQTINGNRGRVIVQFTNGVTPGPRVPVGYQPIAVTPIAG